MSKQHYTQALLSAVPEPDPKIMKSKKRIVLPGEPPSAINPPPGCRLYPRCLYTIDKCRKEEPSLLEYEKEHWVACWLYQKR